LLKYIFYWCYSLG